MVADMTNPSTTVSPTTTTEEPSADDPRATLARAEDTARSVVAGVGADQRGLVTPCAAFDVRGMVAHLIGVLDRIAVIGRDGNVFAVPDRVDGLADDAWLERWDRAAAETMAAWADDARLDATVQVPWDTMTGRAALAIYTNELTVHTWDLAQTTGQQPAWDDGVLRTSLDAIHTHLPTAERTEFWAEVARQLPPGVPFDPPFGDAVPVADDAPLVNRVVAWNGRTP